MRQARRSWLFSLPLRAWVIPSRSRKKRPDKAAEDIRIGAAQPHPAARVTITRDYAPVAAARASLRSLRKPGRPSRRRRKTIRTAIIVMARRYKRRALVRQAIRECLAGCSDQHVVNFPPRCLRHHGVLVIEGVPAGVARE